jgi:hypothetical protein
MKSPSMTFRREGRGENQRVLSKAFTNHQAYSLGNHHKT